MSHSPQMYVSLTFRLNLGKNILLRISQTNSVIY